MSSPNVEPIPYDRSGRRYGPILRRLTEPPGWLMHLAVAIGMAGMLEAFSAPGFYTESALIFILLWLLLIAIWSIRILTALIARRPIRRWGWAIAPIIGLITAGLIAFDIPVQIRFAVSRNDLTRLAQQALAAGPKPFSQVWGSPTQRAGAFDVVVAQVTSDGEVDFVVPGTYFFRSCSGFTYFPNATPFDPEGSFESLGGPWYIWNHTW
jgi:hypothetical protein